MRAHCFDFFHLIGRLGCYVLTIFIIAVGTAGAALAYSIDNKARFCFDKMESPI